MPVNSVIRSVHEGGEVIGVESQFSGPEHTTLLLRVSPAVGADVLGATAVLDVPQLPPTQRWPTTAMIRSETHSVVNPWS